MKKHLVTQDLISSIEWLMKCPSSWKEKALEDLSQKLNRVYGDMPLPAKQGIEFEDKVYNCITNKKFDVGSLKFRELLNRLKHHRFQEKLKQDEIIGEYDCFLYGKIDAYLPGDMLDLKTTGEYKESKYKNSFQHELYCYVKQEVRFTYAVVEWDHYPFIKDVHYLLIEINNLKKLKEQVHAKVLSCFNALKELDLWEVYREKYCLY